MEIKLIEGCKLFILAENGIQEIDESKVGVNFKDGKPEYFLKGSDKKYIIVQSLNKKFASKRMLEILIKNKKSKC